MKSILLIDDEVELADLMADELREAGYNCFTSYSVEEGIKRINDNESYHVVITDYKMAFGGAESIINSCKKNSSDSKIIVATGNLDLEEKSVKEVGADYLFVKPVDYDKLLKVLETL
ncbi:response regulator [Bacteriovoracaceae bacterium]|nr:response regulator [Bacteriovoracaceae bacterium]